jgi:tRNA-Thr(GGU) m(6)t(6)A37 methyltransferase TsaA
VNDSSYDVRPIGWVRSPLTDRSAAPRQADEDAPAAEVVLHPSALPAAADLRVGDDVVLLTWLHQARRDVLAVHPRGDTTRPQQGVFSTRSPDRPNPIGLHTVTINAIEADVISVRNLEAIEGTPVLDIKPVLGIRSLR